MRKIITFVLLFVLSISFCRFFYWPGKNEIRQFGDPTLGDFVPTAETKNLC